MIGIPRNPSPLGGSHWRAAPRGEPAQEQRQPTKVNATISPYAAATGSTTQAPSGDADGVETPVGRVWAEARSVTTSDAAAAVDVWLVVTQQGMRAHVRARNAGATITGGSVRFWSQNPITKAWALGNIDEPLPTGAQEVVTSDQPIAVGAR